MSKRDRFHLKSQLVDTLGTSEWDWTRTNLLLGELGLPELEDDRWGNSLVDVLSSISDEDLVDLYSIVEGVEVREVEDSVHGADAEAAGWRTGYVRLFISHSAVHKGFVGDVASELAVMGIEGFVAHDHLTVSKPWQAQIERALRSMQALVAIVHPELNASPWCQQEIGWAYGRRLPIFAVRMDANPGAFLGSDQWPSGAGRSAREVADEISTWIMGTELGPSIVDGLIAKLASAGNYMEAGAVAERIARLPGLSDEQFERIDQVWWGNDQLYYGALPTKAMRSFYVTNGRQWPPPRPPEASAAAEPSDDEPF